jgi:hypothetical protein
MAWTAPSVRTTGDLITASIWNVDLVADLLLLKTSIDSSGNLSPTAPTTLTLSANVAGAVTVTQNCHAIDTNAAASSGDLQTITAGANVRAGHLLTLTQATAAHTIRVVDALGNISSQDGDFYLDGPNKIIVLQLIGTTWREVARAPQPIYDYQCTDWNAGPRVSYTAIGSGTAAPGQFGAILSTTAAATSGGKAQWACGWGVNASVQGGVSGGNVRCTMRGTLSTKGTDGQLFWGLSLLTTPTGSTLNLATEAHIGLKAVWSGSGVVNIIPTTCDGTEATTPNFFTIAVGDEFSLAFDVFGTNRVVFYAKKNNGAWTQLTISTNIPTTLFWQLCAIVINSGVASASVFQVFSSSVRRN